MDLLITIVSFVIVLVILVFFHELGHYWGPRRNGIVVEEFGMGYPPRLIKLFTYDGTAFTINLIPFGGFARMKGEDGADMTPGSFNAASRWARASTLVAGPLMNVVLAVIFFTASYLAGFPMEAAHPQLTTVAPNSIAAQLGLQPGDILLNADNRPTLMSIRPEVDRPGWEAKDAAAPTTLTIGRADQILEVAVPSQKQVEELLATVSYEPVLDTQITEIAKNSPAELKGIQPKDFIYKVGDTVVSFQGVPVNEAVDQNLGREVPVTLLRDGKWVTVFVTPRLPADRPDNEGPLGTRLRVNSAMTTLPLGEAMWMGVSTTWQQVALIIQLPYLLMSGYVAPSDAQLSGPVGIARLVGDAVSATMDTGFWFPIWQLSAALSAALAITNLLPLPALDGGRLLFILIETLRGRRINPEREGLVHMVGFMLLLGLMIYITVQDIRTGGARIDWHTLLGQ